MKKTVLIGINSKYVHTNLAIRYIREYCQNKGVEIDIYENSINNSILSIVGIYMKNSLKLRHFLFIYGMLNMFLKLLMN